MAIDKNQTSSRRDFLKMTGHVAAASSLAAVTVPRVHAAEDNTIRLALIGCGARGTGAAANALMVNQGPVKLVAMADVFPGRVEQRLKYLGGNIEASWDRTTAAGLGTHIDVPPERRFVGFDAYRQAMDCLRPGDVAILATPPAFRWVHFGYAIEKGLNVFMEKPLTSDGPTARRMLELGEQATAKNLKVGVGLMSRHARPIQELHERIADGEIGDIFLLRAYRLIGPLVTAFSHRWPGTPSELHWQIQRFHSFIWASGGCFNDFYIHVIDNACWMKNTWPVKARAIGGRHYRNGPDGLPYVDQNFDSYSVEYTFADGAKLMLEGRCMPGCENDHSSCAQGTKGAAVISKSGDCGPPSSTYRSQTFDRADLTWRSKTAPGERSPYNNEWNDLIDAIRGDQPYNEVKNGVEASVVCNMGRRAAHTGKTVTFEQALQCDLEYAPGIDKFTEDSPAPVQADAEGRYPVPQPGIITDREY